MDSIFTGEVKNFVQEVLLISKTLVLDAVEDKVLVLDTGEAVLVLCSVMKMVLLIRFCRVSA